MNALLILAHGSRKKRSNDEVQSLAQRYEVAYPDQFDAVYAGFMELAQPDIHMTIRTAIDAGATQLTILPYFLIWTVGVLSATGSSLVVRPDMS